MIFGTDNRPRAVASTAAGITTNESTSTAKRSSCLNKHISHVRKSDATLIDKLGKLLSSGAKRVASGARKFADQISRVGSHVVTKAKAFWNTEVEFRSPIVTKRDSQGKSDVSKNPPPVPPNKPNLLGTKTPATVEPVLRHAMVTQSTQTNSDKHDMCTQTPPLSQDAVAVHQPAPAVPHAPPPAPPLDLNRLANMNMKVTGMAAVEQRQGNLMSPKMMRENELVRGEDGRLRDRHGKLRDENGEVVPEKGSRVQQVGIGESDELLAALARRRID